VLDQAVKGGAPAIMAAVITADGTWTGASGVVGPSGKPATKDDVFAIASATKPVVAALLLRLAELGKIDLDAPLSSFGLDDDLTNGATVRQALEMRGGIGDTDPAVLAKVDADCSHAWTRDEVLAAFPKPVTTAGGRWAYSNPGYKLAGYAAETATGGSLADAVRTYVLDPAGVDRLVFQGEGAKTPTPWAVPIDGHAGAIAAADYGKGGALPCLSDATFSSAGAGMASDASSLARWAWALFAGKIIDERSLATMTETSGDQYGLGIWQFDDFRPNLAYGHAGNKPGYAPIFVVFPDRQVVIALAITEQEADPFAPVGKLLAALQ
jgi:D-alanyl-D-alanine carboxypeptidase